VGIRAEEQENREPETGTGPRARDVETREGRGKLNLEELPTWGPIPIRTKVGGQQSEARREPDTGAGNGTGGARINIEGQQSRENREPEAGTGPDAGGGRIKKEEDNMRMEELLIEPIRRIQLEPRGD